MSKMGRPEIEIDWKTVDKLCLIQCTAEEIASVLGCSSDTIERRCKKEYEITFAEYIRQKAQGGKASLRRKQWSAADGGNVTMLIWLGKQYLGQADKPLESDNIDEVPKTVRLIVEDARVTAESE